MSIRKTYSLWMKSTGNFIPFPTVTPAKKLSVILHPVHLLGAKEFWYFSARFMSCLLTDLLSSLQQSTSNIEWEISAVRTITTRHDLFSPGKITCPITIFKYVAADVMGPCGVSNYIL